MRGENSAQLTEDSHINGQVSAAAAHDHTSRRRLQTVLGRPRELGTQVTDRTETL